MPPTNSLPSAFDSFAALNRFFAVEEVSPAYYQQHWRSIEMAGVFIRLFASSYPSVEPALCKALSLPLAEAANVIREAVSVITFSENDLNWFDNQMTLALRALLPLVRDSQLPAYLNETKWGIEGAFQPAS